MRVKEFGPEANYWPRPEIEHRDFLDAIKARSKPAYHAEAEHPPPFLPPLQLL